MFMRSDEIGRLFESATLKIFKELFLHWGYEIFGSKVQKSGTQHGFDVYYKISKNHAILNTDFHRVFKRHFSYGVQIILRGL